MTLLLLLLGCPAGPAPDDDDVTQNDDDATVDDDDAVGDDDADDDDATPITTYGSTLAEAGLCPAEATLDPPAPGPFTAATGASPFGTGTQNDVILGALEDPSALVQAPQSGSVSYTFDLDVETFDLYVPPAYDGSEPYGLLVHIDAGDNGGVRGSWTEVLDEQKLIWVGGDGIGNAHNVDLRMGKATMGGYRALELFHVDRARVFATGTSGGARSAHVASFLHPDLYKAAVPVCGAGWFHAVEQAYETQDPDAHYEFWGDWFYPDVGSQDFGAWLAGFSPRQALLTSFDDFREGDIRNIYHHGAAPDGFAVRLLERGGGHCDTDASHARDGLAWVQSPDFAVVGDGLTDGDLGTSTGPGHGLVDGGAPELERASESAAGLLLHATADQPGLVLARDRVAWNDPAGAVISVELRPDAAVGLAGQRATLGLREWDPTVAVADLAGLEGDGAALLVSAEQPLDRPQLAIVRSYLKAVGREHGLILNNACPKLEMKRVIAPPRS